MSDHIPAAIQIGGPVPRSITEAITNAEVSLEWGGESFEPITPDDLIAHLDPVARQLHLYDRRAVAPSTPSRPGCATITYPTTASLTPGTSSTAWPCPIARTAAR